MMTVFKFNTVVPLHGNYIRNNSHMNSRQRSFNRYVSDLAKSHAESYRRIAEVYELAKQNSSSKEG